MNAESQMLYSAHNAHMSICLCIYMHIYVNAYLTTQADEHLTRKAIHSASPGLGVRNLRMTKINILGMNIKAPGA